MDFELQIKHDKSALRPRWTFRRWTTKWLLGLLLKH